MFAADPDARTEPGPRLTLIDVTAVLEFLAEQPIIVIGLAVMVGSLLGGVSVKGISLGAAGILFVALALGALGSAFDVVVEIPEPIGNLGVSLFALATGIISGPAFFAALRSAWPMMLTVAAALGATAALTWAIGDLAGLSREAIAGVFAGSQTNTPALAAAGGSAEATVGYASAYLVGVLAMLAMTAVTLGGKNKGPGAPAPLVTVTIRVDRTQPVTVPEIAAQVDPQVLLVRYQPSGSDEVVAVAPDSVFGHGDLVSLVGPADEVDAAVDLLGHRSSHDLTEDRTHLDFRRITLSNPRLSGHRVADLRLESRLGATVSRVRRGDVDMVALPEMRLQIGDRLRVVAPPEQMAAVTEHLGDSSRGMTALTPVALGAGLVLGLLVGEIPIPLPGIGTMSIGAAAGALIVGLVMGRVRRVGRFITTMPLTSATVIAEIGMMVFLAYAGCKAGTMIVDAVASGEIVRLMAVGAAASIFIAVVTYVLIRWVFHSTGNITGAGIHGGVQTQPAILAFANERTGFDPRVAVGYALVYPTAMIVKVIAAQLLTSL